MKTDIESIMNTSKPQFPNVIIHVCLNLLQDISWYYQDLLNIKT